MNKKGQVTLFIIIGVILLLTAGLVIYLTTQKVIKPVEEKIIMPEGTQPIYEYISECVYQTAKEGIIKMGLQGGYLDLPAAITNTPASYVAIDSMGFAKTPYWLYNKQDRTPTKEFLQMEINSQLRQKLMDCIDFSSFSPQYTVLQKGEFEPRTTLTEENVIIELNWPLEIQTAGKTIALNKIVKNIDVKLKEIHEIAAKTMEFENSRAVFENITMGLLSANPRVPSNGMTLDCTPKKWRLNEVQDEMKNTMHYNVQSVRIENTPYLPFSASPGDYARAERGYDSAIRQLEKDQEPDWPTSVPEDSYEYFKMLLDIGISQTDIKTSFMYRPEWGMHLMGYPNEGSTLSSNRIQGNRKYLSYLCINQWHFVYDIEYPVVMTLKDDTAFKGEGYTFQYAFPVLIDDNTANRELVDRRPFLTTKYYDEFCDELGENVYDIRATGITPGAIMAREMDEANITYACFDRYCDLGTTQADEGVYRLRTGIPKGCGHPFITATKPGYLPATKQLTQNVLEIPLKKLKTMKYEIIVHEYNSRTNTTGETRTKIRDTEDVTIMMGIIGTDYYQNKVYKADDTIDLVDGTAEYEISILFSRMNDLIGGYSNSQAKITYEEMAGKDTIIFHVFEYIPTPINDEGKAKTAQYLYDEGYKEVLKPTFK